MIRSELTKEQIKRAIADYWADKNLEYMFGKVAEIYRASSPVTITKGKIIYDEDVNEAVRYWSKKIIEYNEKHFGKLLIKING